MFIRWSKSLNPEHQYTCPWLELVKNTNKVKFTNLIDAHKQGFDNCAYCLGGSRK